uniref:DUF3437 domain-containing protein n=1 Tax=Echinostoma caproni TaxID=27848 RepID=A0A183A1J8_9TREM
LGRKFGTIHLDTLPTSIGLDDRSHLFRFDDNTSLADWLLQFLCHPNSGDHGVRSSTFEHRLFLWLNLFFSHTNKVKLLQDKLDLLPLLIGLVHADDQIRSLALNGLSCLSSTLLSQKDSLERFRLYGLTQSLSDLGPMFLIGVLSLHSSSSPMARKALLCAFNDFVRSVRNACSSIRPNVARDVVPCRILNSSDCGWLLDTALGSLATVSSSSLCGVTENWTRQELAVRWLAQLMDYQAHSWSSTTLSEYKDSCATQLTMFWPGMTYQRCKILTDIAYHAIGLLNFEHVSGEKDLSGQWRTGYAPSESVPFVT